MASRIRIIVVEDHDELREATVEALTGMGYRVQGVDCAEALDDMLAAFLPDLLVLDLNLPGEDGLHLAQRMRKANPDIGIIMVTARNQVRDISRGYDSGADIYLTKPTSLEELSGAVGALSRRIVGFESAPDRLWLNPETLQLFGPRGTVHVSALESTQLTGFAMAAEHRLETWQLMEMAGKGDELSKSTLEVQIVRLRKKLEQAGATAPTIKAIRGMGYLLCVPLVIERRTDISRIL